MSQNTFKLSNLISPHTSVFQMKLLMISARCYRTNPQISIRSVLILVPRNNLILKSETIHRYMATGKGEGRRLFLLNANKSQHDLIWRDIFLGSRLQGQQRWGWMTARPKERWRNWILIGKTLLACLLSAQHCARHWVYGDELEDVPTTFQELPGYVSLRERVGLPTCNFLQHVANPHPSLRVFFPEPPVISSHSTLCNYHWL